MMNFDIVKYLITKHVEMRELAIRLACSGVWIEELNELNLSKIALDLIGFPDCHDTYLRSGEGLLSAEMREIEIEDLVRQLYAKHEEQKLQKPHLFVKE